ncbi:MAG: Glu/Leu/Phe/Val dehydrogenase dimerization domain-containing protein [Planctomycetota bacterium]|nr:Glu/Leu/Phe/Val dehydrogenase dimerization domain-containing protein [Planctomycetota bacterium]
MELLETMAHEGHEQIIGVQDAPSGLRAWIAIHGFSPKPAFGGIRIINYRSERDALSDSLRLSRIMTYKCALAGVHGSGAKTVVIANSIIDRTAAIRCLGRQIERLDGAYQTGPDAGFTADDQHALMQETSHFACFGIDGGLQPAGEATAVGAIHGIISALEWRGAPKVSEATIAIQGLGAVGAALARRFVDLGATVIGADVSAERTLAAERIGVKVVSPKDILSIECDVLISAAIGGTIHDVSISSIKAKIIAGVANNTLGHDSQADLLKEKGILFLPDFALNSGALIEGSNHLHTGETSCPQQLEKIGSTIGEILSTADSEKISTVEAAYSLAAERVINTTGR